jgi:hypothetical protein
MRSTNEAIIRILTIFINFFVNGNHLFYMQVTAQRNVTR